MEASQPRVDLKPFEKAKMIATLVQRGATIEDIAEKGCMSLGHVKLNLMLYRKAMERLQNLSLTELHSFARGKAANKVIVDDVQDS